MQGNINKWIKNVRMGNSVNRIYKVTKFISVAFGHFIDFIHQNQLSDRPANGP